jgi:Bacterial Ig-like domain
MKFLTTQISRRLRRLRRFGWNVLGQISNFKSIIFSRHTQIATLPPTNNACLPARQEQRTAYSVFLITIYCLLITSCAQMGEPNGGTKDSTAPEVIPQKTFPANGNVNFGSDRISITFNEYINLKSQSVVITPAISKKPQIRSKGKKVEIIFQERLKDSTTYTINFSGAISDITENNTVQNFQYVFSTGPYLDSLSISGKVINAFSQAGINSSTVILHNAENDSAIYTEKPAYFLKTEKDGSFRLANLKQGKYNLYSLNDKNADLMFNGYPEEISFLDSAVQLNTNITDIKLKQFKPVNKKIYQTSGASVSKWMQVYRYNKLLENISVEALNPAFNEKIKVHTNHVKDSVFYLMLTDTLVTDTIFAKLKANNVVIDTIKFTSHRSKKMTSKTTFRLNALSELYLVDSIFIATNMPCTFNRDLITVYDTLHKKSIPFSVSASLFGIKIIPEKLTEKSPLKVTCLPGSITSTVTGSTCDTLKAVSIFMPVEKMGSIQLTLKQSSDQKFSDPVCVLLMDGKYLRKQKISTDQPVINFELLKPATYSFYLFNDDDKDGMWSPGSLDTKQQAEKINWYTQPVKVKANWTQDLTWIL